MNTNGGYCLVDFVRWHQVSDSNLCANPHPAAMNMIEARIPYLRDVDWETLSGNPAAGHILKRNVDRIDWWMLSKNPCDDALDLLEANMDLVDWGQFSRNTNPRAIRILAANLEKVEWWSLSGNPAAAGILRANLDRVFWGEVIANSGAMDIIEANMDRVVWDNFCQNENPRAIEILSRNMDRVNWHHLSRNPNAIKILSENEDKIVWHILIMNRNAGELMDKNIDKINQGMQIELSANPGAMEFLRTYQGLINWNTIWSNPSIFKIDYEGIYWRCDVCKEEMMARIAHPVNAPCFQWLGWDEDNVLGQESRDYIIVKPNDNH